MTTTTQHLPHLLMLAVPLLVFAGLFGLEWRRTSGVPLAQPLRLMALGSVGAAGVHGAVVGEHAHEASLLGWFFALLCLAQLTWVVVLLLAPVRRVVLAGVVGNLGVVALWAWTRAVSVPFGVAGGGREGIGWPDLLATALEAGCVLAGLQALYRAIGGRPSPLVVPWSKWDTSTTRNSPPPRKVSSPSGLRPSQDTKSLRPSKRSTFATRS